MSLISAKDALNLFAKSDVREKSMKAAEQILNAMSQEIQTAAQDGQRCIILNAKSYQTEAAKLYYAPCLAIDYLNCPVEYEIYEIVHSEIKDRLSEAGYHWETYNNGESHFKILW